MILAGNTAAGVYHEWPEAPVIINIKGVRELSCKIDRNKACCDCTYWLSLSSWAALHHTMLTATFLCRVA